MSDKIHDTSNENAEYQAFDAEFVASGAGPSETPPRESNLVRAWRQLRPGDVVAGKYRVERTIGQSGLASIAQVRHLVLDQYAVLKYLRPEARAFPETIANFLRGALLLSQIRSEHVAQVLDVGMLELGTPYIVLEQPEGPDLAQVLRVRGPLPIPEAISHIAQACDGIAQAHAHGVTHGNLSPFNFFLVKRADGTPIIRVADFGSVDVFDLSGVLSADVGILPSRALIESLRYLSPEHVRTPDSVDARSDVWALGAILHELLIGEPVYRDKTIPGLLAMIAADAPKSARTLRPEIPGDLAAIILRCLEKDRVARYANAGLLANALRTCNSTITTEEAAKPSSFGAPSPTRSTRPPPLPSVPPPPSRKSPTSGFVPAMGYSIPAPPVRSNRSLLVAAAIIVTALVTVLTADVVLRLTSPHSTATASEQQSATQLVAGTSTPEAQQAPNNTTTQIEVRPTTQIEPGQTTPSNATAALAQAAARPPSAVAITAPVVRHRKEHSSAQATDAPTLAAVAATLKTSTKQASESSDPSDPFGSF